MESDDVERDLSSLPRRLKFRSLSEILSVIPQEIPRTVTLYRNGYTFDDDNILWPLDDPQCAEYLEVLLSFFFFLFSSNFVLLILQFSLD